MNQDWFVKIRRLATGWIVISKRGDTVTEYAYSVWRHVTARLEEELGVTDEEHHAESD